MGYYSEVAAMMYKEDYENLINKIKAHEFPEDTNYSVQEIEEDALETLDFGYTDSDVIDFNNTSERFVRLHWTNIKWGFYPDTELIEQYFRDHEVDFVRLGESSDDVEEHWGLELYEIGTVRYLEFD